jgi:hypothetical protein
MIGLLTVIVYATVPSTVPEHVNKQLAAQSKFSLLDFVKWPDFQSTRPEHKKLNYGAPRAHHSSFTCRFLLMDPALVA